ncbi:DUF3152 domain-containing protein [Glycomyces algeriensis]|uniref:DUF3152 domain-containing protein n=1 Tax=Glycomyces algeriensis TaxID=256037 RepID=A0A9W6G7Q5_9ACTN|nr:DUF3152 domain-containing protein [Glycomyces algeriensis]MDA1366124.1 DUF3152 domain-containing protein [Glycomyces algeriensis]MDR7349108.1 hypothetical protein [Glycomyces algeriensis]GLI41808.1 hypothetical protein GALLR39Z86_16580 [Glycomyces algeriensis]
MTEGRLARLKRIRRLRRRRRFVFLAILVLTAGAGLYFALGATDSEKPQALDEEERIAPTTVADPASPSPGAASPSPETEVAVTPPLYFSGTGTWSYAEPVNDAVVGDAGTLLQYDVAVENGLELDAAEFGAFVNATLADDRSWTAGGAWRFQQVAEGAGADFTVYLASPEQRAYLCGSQNTTVSCRNGDNVVINSARWITGVDHWDGTLDTYRQYAVNHEVGHRLGHGHEVCPADGETSPVMAQQTYQLAGCVGNAWPFPDGTTYVSGPVGDYNGPDLPPDDFVDQ